MGYRTYHNYGYGILVDAIKTTPERMENLLALAPNYRKQIHDWFEECEITEPTMHDYREFDQEHYLGLATILKEVIWEAEGIELLACDNFDGMDYLIYEPSYPWQISEKSMTLTEEKLADLFRKYVNILTDTPIVLDYQEVGNGG